MRRITSIERAIKYFKDNTKIETRRDSSGREYQVYIPPTSFKGLRITELFYTVEGKVAGELTNVYEPFQWKNYVQVIESKKKRIVRLALYHG